MEADGKVARVHTRPRCDFCLAEALYDGKTFMGPWANMCGSDFKTYGMGLGEGRGQMLLLKDEDLPLVFNG